MPSLRFNCSRLTGLLVLALMVALARPEALVSGAELSGLKVGEKAPAFELKDQSGRTVKLVDLLKQGPVAVVFYRSADW